ncbi:sensor histidine kinase [Streptomyces sp. NBC_00582]|uniref:sensor histidine kinase n=1 Tax=Streptomyces sp. NBC_00582 TaxID=2975783 RepID=UPI002E808622|nr:sensor histidine kinase [Streptomyces sp. NBC_00582]WUB68016.1 sensor histidine kinase [Streptomyces sp. NBC_00582]
MTRVQKWVVRGLRTLRDDLWTTRADPLPPSVWLRWLPHGLVWLVAFGTTVANFDQMIDRYQLGVQYGTVCALLEGAAVVLALWRPVPAWWLSLVVTVVAALGARGEMLADLHFDARQWPLGAPRPAPAPDLPGWPWGPPGLVAHCLVLLLLALRVPTRAAVGALTLTALATYLVQGVLGGASYTPTGALAVTLFAAVVLLGTALRGRRVARTQLVEQAGITAEERARRTLLEERNRIARELHDVVAHHMSVISIQAQVAPHLVENPSEELKENLAGIRKNALEALTELRRVLGVLRSENPEDPYGLGAAGTGSAPDTPQPTLDRLDALLENTRAAGLVVRATVEGEPPAYSPGVQLSAYRIVQEALSNALRHAPGSHVRVQILHQARGLTLDVTNSRPSGPVRPSPGAGHGLLGMRERAAMLGGHVVAHPTLQGGFSVLAFLPRDGVAPPRPEPRIFEGLEIVFPDDPSPTGDDPSPTGEETP